MARLENHRQFTFTREGVRKIDRDAIELYGMKGLVLMENAAREAAKLILQHCENTDFDHVVICCGGGNNGGDGYAIARHLHNNGCKVTVAICSEPKTEEAIANKKIAEKMEICMTPLSNALLLDATLIIDAMFGTGIDTPVRGDSKEMIDRINATSKKIVAIDTPSGLDCDTGLPLGVAIKAAFTVTFVGIKMGFALPCAHEYTGDVFVVDIGCPSTLINKYAMPNS